MQRLVILGISILVLTGCSIFQTPEPVRITETQYIERPLAHPPLPRPVNFYHSDPRVVTAETIQNDPDRVVYQCFEWNDAQELAISLNDTRAYINSLRAILCSYRQELDEQFCEEFNIND